MFRAITAWTLLFVLAGLSTAAAQLEPTVDGCTQMCDPKAADVNGPEVRTGTDTVKSVLYFHFQNAIDKALINTQANHPDEENIHGSFFMPTLYTNTGQEPNGQQVDVKFKYNTFLAISSAGFIEIGPDGDWRTHQEPGVAEDVEIVGDTIPLFFYLSAYPVPSRNSDDFVTQKNALAVMPQVAVRATMTAGRNPGYGTVIAEGDSAERGRINVIMAPDAVQKEIYEIRVDMHVKQSTIPSVWTGGEGFAVEITPYQIEGEGAAEGYQFTQSEWRARLGPNTPPHMVVTIAKPLVTKSTRMNLFNNALFLRWSVSSPWGSYDVDPQSFRVDVTGPTNPDPAATGLSRPAHVKWIFEHNGHFKPTNVTWKFDYRKAGLADGTYTVQMSAMNLQGTYRLAETMTFRVVDGLPADVEILGKNARAGTSGDGGGGLAGGKSPGLAGLAVVAALVGVAMARRRRPGG